MRVTNPGDVTLTRDVRALVFEGDEELWDGDTQEVTLAPGENETLEWDWTSDEYGTFIFRAELEQADEDSSDDAAEGELRAVGDVLRDQLFFMQRCGINSFQLREDKDMQDALNAFTELSVKYQTAADGAEPIYKYR